MSSRQSSAVDKKPWKKPITCFICNHTTRLSLVKCRVSCYVWQNGVPVSRHGSCSSKLCSHVKCFMIRFGTQAVCSILLTYILILSSFTDNSRTNSVGFLCTGSFSSLPWRLAVSEHM